MKSHCCLPQFLITTDLDLCCRPSFLMKKYERRLKPLMSLSYQSVVENNLLPHVHYVTGKTQTPAATHLGLSYVLCLYWLRAGYLSGQFKKAICSFSPCLHLHGSGVCSGTRLTIHKLQATQMKMSTRPWCAE